MVMGEGGEGAQPTQVVAVDNGDGTQQLVGFLAEKYKSSFYQRHFQAIPVMDPETGQETYMIIDPQVHTQSTSTFK